ncbi:hypothetical protein PN499_20030 [Kamptonema animale CS-326]|nr:MULTISPECIES: hypothetical protein [Kamptonema]MDB9513488.1 hypothetical protein [Kamptonema animale CS-326]CBN57076.1 hypothetical protein OSCI_3310009 [Kamptonema sp. PCC 6506]
MRDRLFHRFWNYCDRGVSLNLFLCIYAIAHAYSGQKLGTIEHCST